MKIVIFILLLNSITSAGQGFEFESDSRKVVMPFQLINNLIFLPINVNGAQLNFLLDSGVEETILFSLEDSEKVVFNDIEKIELRGLGVEGSVAGLKSANNYLSFGGFHDHAHDIYIILDQDFNFSSHIGIPVNGIIGYRFFKNYLIEINYDSKKITVYRDQNQVRKRITRKFSQLPITIEKNKPYVSAVVEQRGAHSVKLLVDTGSSDAVWLFPQATAISIPELHFIDYLGRGFSGDIHGRRARLSLFNIAGYAFKDPIVAFPDVASLRNLAMVENRAGSVGGEILRRFTIIFDYEKGMMYLMKGKQYDRPFDYNMSGIELQHGGLQWVQETVPMQTVVTSAPYELNPEKMRNEFKYKFELKPLYSISAVRSGSPAEITGLRKDDVLVSVNYKKAYRYSLQQLNTLLKTEEGKYITIEIERNNIVMAFRFQLKKML